MAWLPMDTAPRDGREVLARRHNGVSFEHCVVWWDGDGIYPWASNGTAYPERRLDEWHNIPGQPR